MKPTEELDVALKILHTADWHLGQSFPLFSEGDQTKLSRARIEAVDKLLGLAESYAVDAVLCAGDLFDEPVPKELWWRELLRLFGRRTWKNRPVFLLPGNHDPLWPNSVWAAEHPFRSALPSWVHVVDRDDFEFQISDAAVLYAAPCRSQAGCGDLASRLPPRSPGDERIRIGIVHGSTFDIPRHQTSFPIAADAAQQRGLNYLAIGDHHAFREIPPKAAPTVYPGAPEATKFGEGDTGCVAIVFFPRQGRPPIVRRESVGRWRWRDERCTNLDELEALRGQDLKDCVVRLTFDMEVTLRDRERVDAILEELQGNEAMHGTAGVLRAGTTGLALASGDAGDFDPLLPEVLKAVVDRLKAEASEPDGEIAKHALYHLRKTLHALANQAPGAMAASKGGGAGQ